MFAGANRNTLTFGSLESGETSSTVELASQIVDVKGKQLGDNFVVAAITQGKQVCVIVGLLRGVVWGGGEHCHEVLLSSCDHLVAGLASPPPPDRCARERRAKVCYRDQIRAQRCGRGIRWLSSRGGQ